MAALHYWQQNSHSLPVAADPASAADDQAGPTASTLSFRYAEAAMAVTPSSQGSISPALLAQLMLAAHHPIISNVRKQPQAAWTAVKRRIHKLGVLYDGEFAPVSEDGVYVQTVCRLSTAVRSVY